jgi:hypothetical protein
MLPPEGTFLHWFLSNRAIHMWITMVLSITPHFSSLPLPGPGISLSLSLSLSQNWC